MTRIFLTIYIVLCGIILIPIFINLATDKFRKQSEFCFFGGCVILILIGVIHMLSILWM
jgi:hypothetical protein